MKRFREWLLMGCLALLAGSLSAADKAAVEVPESLRDWQGWVMDAHREQACPPQYAQLDRRECRWPGRLSLQANAQGATFAQDWQLFADGWITLPGNSEHWPVEVRVNGKTQPVLEHDGLPVVQLAAGEYRVEGALRWRELPQRLPVAVDTALVSLTVNGKSLPPSMDGADVLFAADNEVNAGEADDLSVQVFRKLSDDIPQQLETRLKLRVAGRARELLMGRLLLAGFQVMDLQSDLPARIEADGRLRIQLRPGAWTLTLQARADSSKTQFAMQRMDDVWPTQEIWGTADNRDLRQIRYSGADSMDPAQTDMPSEWRQLPAWLLQDDGQRAPTQLVLSEIQRGDSLDAAAGGMDLRIQRDLWLDFDGRGFTVRDSIQGALPRAMHWRMAAGSELGRVDVNGQPQLVTRLDNANGAEPAGVQLRAGSLNLLAVSRQSAGRSFSVSGWQQDFSSATARLHLPPGWLLLHAGGVDSVNSSWVSGWNLWAIFLVLIIAGSVFRLLGVWQGVCALLALALTYHVPGAPVFAWLFVLVLLGLMGALPVGRLRRVLSWFAAAGGLLLVALVLEFAVHALRAAVYPQLDRGQVPMAIMKASLYHHPSEASDNEMAAGAAEPVESRADLPASAAPMANRARKAKRETPARPKPLYDSQARIQTGPGVPTWDWQTVSLGWSGPVVAGQTVSLYLLPPAVSRLLHVLSVLLVVTLLLQLLLRLRQMMGEDETAPGTSPTAGAVAVLACCLLMAHTPPAQADLPTADLLKELENRLTRLPACQPQCASLNQGLLQVDAAGLRLELAVDAAEAVAVPLPARRNGWQPRTVVVDGSVTTALRSDDEGLLWLALPAGSHRIVLEGPLAGTEVTLPFAMTVHNLASRADGWQISGIDQGQVVGGSIQLSREARADAAAAARLVADVAPAFVQVDRQLVFGLEWEVETRVTRLAPASGAINVAVDLLPGESVLTAGITPVDGRVPVALAAGESAFSWHSSLKTVDRLQLHAGDGRQWVERWSFDVSPLWQVAFSGLNPVKQAAYAAAIPLWQPWPGESLQLAITRPQAVPGATHTIERTALVWKPGERSTEGELTLTVRSSQGGELPLPLPAGAELHRLTVDGREQSLPQAGAPLRLPLRPGEQTLGIEWQQPAGIAVHERLPTLDFGEPLTNITLQLHLPTDRWLLLVGGPLLGPALLFWGVLLTMLLVAAALGRSGLTPLRGWQWALLGLGMSTVNSAGSLPVVLCFLLLAWRQRLDAAAMSRTRFNTVQFALAVLTLIAASCLLSTIPLSLLSSPDMMVTGNNSYAGLLSWYQDRSTGQLPGAWAISLPMWLYRSVMLAWSLWLVFALLDWCRWAWRCFSAGGLWRAEDKRLGEQNPPA